MNGVMINRKERKESETDFVRPLNLPFFAIFALPAVINKR